MSDTKGNPEAPQAETKIPSTEQKTENVQKPVAPASTATPQKETPPPPPANTPPPTPTASQTPAGPKPKSNTGSNLKMLWLSLLMFLLGIGGGILLFMTYPKQAEKLNRAIPTPAVSPSPIILPANAMNIGECSDGEGEKFASGETTVQEMRYLVFKGKLIGYQQVLTEGELKNNSIKMPAGKIDHISVKTLSESEVTGEIQEDISTEPTASLMMPDSRNNPVLNSNRKQKIYVNFYLIGEQEKAEIKCEIIKAPPPVSSQSAAVTEGAEPQTDIKPLTTVNPVSASPTLSPIPTAASTRN